MNKMISEVVFLLNKIKNINIAYFDMLAATSERSKDGAQVPVTF